jgi:hypothetical protein
MTINFFKSRIAKVTFAAVLLGACQLHAQTRTQPISKTGPVTTKTLIVETVYPFTVQEFAPPLEIAMVPSNVQDSFNHPEHTLRSYFSAISSKDYQRYLQCWTKDSQLLMQQKDKSANRSPGQWQDIWQSTFVGKRIQVTHWITYGRYVLFNYRLVGAPPETGESVVALVQEDGQWKLSQGLREDPVPLNWRESSGRIRQPASSLVAR